MRRVRASLDRLTVLVADNPQQTANLEGAAHAGRTPAGHARCRPAAFTDYGIPAVRAVLTLSRASSTVEDVGAQRERMDAIEAELLRHRQSEAARVRLFTLISLLVTLAIAVGFFIVAVPRHPPRDVYARRDAERALRSSDQYNRSIIDSSPDCLSVLTTGAHVTQMNPQGMSLLGSYDFSSVAGKRLVQLLEWRGPARAHERYQRGAQRPRGPLRRPDQPRHVEREMAGCHRQSRARAGGQPERLLAVARDVTDVKRSEDSLRSANQFLDSLIQTLPVMVVVKDVQHAANSSA